MLSLRFTSPGGHSMPQTVTSATPTQTSSTLDGASAALVAHAAAQQQQQSQMPNRPGLGTREVCSIVTRSRQFADIWRQADGGWCISWCKDRYWGEVIAAACGVNGLVKVGTLVEHDATR